MATPPSVPEAPKSAITPAPAPTLSADKAQDAPVAEVVLPRGNFWQQPWVQTVLPLATSLMLHITIIVVGFVTYKAVEKVVQVVKEQIIIPESELSTDKPGGVVNPGPLGDPNRRSEQDVDKNISESEGWATKTNANMSAALTGGGQGDSSDSSIGIGSNAAYGTKNGTGVGNGGEGGGPLAPFGVPGGGSGRLGPKSSFVGLGGNARKIMYLCDSSGSMLGVFPRLKVELKNSIDKLVTVQAFNVIFFSDGDVTGFSQGNLVVANPDNKRKIYDWVDGISAHGGTNPMPAIEEAFKEKPELIYILTDGFDNISSFEALIALFRRMNTDHKIKINCIFLRENDDKALEATLTTIATENGGKLKIIDKKEM